MIRASMPVVGLAYKIGVKNIKNVIRIESIFPISLTIPFRSEKIKPRPRVNNIMGIINSGISSMAVLGAIL